NLEPKLSPEPRQTRPRAPARVKEPPTRAQLQRREGRQTRAHPQSQARTSRLNDKLKERAISHRPLSARGLDPVDSFGVRSKELLQLVSVLGLQHLIKDAHQVPVGARDGSSLKRVGKTDFWVGLGSDR